MTTTYQITSKGGATQGYYDGETPADALAALHRDAGYPRVRAEAGRIVWPDDETRDVCGGLDEWIVTAMPSVREAEAAILDAARQDIARGAYQEDAEEAIDSWRSDAARAGDLALVRAIDLLGERAPGRAAAVYARARR